MAEKSAAEQIERGADTVAGIAVATYETIDATTVAGWKAAKAFAGFTKEMVLHPIDTTVSTVVGTVKALPKVGAGAFLGGISLLGAAGFVAGKLVQKAMEFGAGAVENWNKLEKIPAIGFNKATEAVSDVLGGVGAIGKSFLSPHKKKDKK